MIVQVILKYKDKKEYAYCRSIVCEEANVPKVGMKVRMENAYGTLDSIEPKPRPEGTKGLKVYIGYVIDDGR